MIAQLLTLREYTMARGTAVPSENGNSPLFSEEMFAKLLCLERKRAERSRKPFALMLVDASKPLGRNDGRVSLPASPSRSLSLHGRQTSGAGTRKAL
ncbi:MAG: hypothetical protein MZV49_07795 [Rhodopseudomonas palustris]|nr:hypothetical protein [Rhodopseudomonas palustris]